MRLMMPSPRAEHAAGEVVPSCRRSVIVTDLEAETEAGEAVDRPAVLVKPGGEADAVGKAQAHDLDRARRLRLGGGQQLAGIVPERHAGVRLWAVSGSKREQEGRASS